MSTSAQSLPYASFLRRLRGGLGGSLPWLIVYTLILLALPALEAFIPVTGTDRSIRGRGYNSHVWDLESLREAIVVVVPCWLALPWILALYQLRRRNVVASMLTGAVMVGFLLTCSLILKLHVGWYPNSVVPSVVGRLLDATQPILAYFTVFLILTEMVLILGLIVHYSGSGVMRLVGYRVNAYIRPRGYEYDGMQAYMLLDEIGWDGVYTLPPRDELAVVPGFGDGSPAEVAAILKQARCKP